MCSKKKKEKIINPAFAVCVAAPMKRKYAPTAYSKQVAKKPRLSRQNAAVGPQLAAGIAKQNALAALVQEIKYFDVSFATDASTTPAVGALNAVAAGDTNLLRDGNKIAMKALGIRFSMTNESIAQNVKTRVVIVLDHNANGASPAWTDVFDAATIESQRKVSNMSRFEILMDKVVVLNASTSTAGAFQKGFFKKYIKMPNVIASYADGTGNSPITNALSIMYISDVASGLTDQDVTGTTRLYFHG